MDISKFEAISFLFEFVSDLFVSLSLLSNLKVNCLMKKGNLINDLKVDLRERDYSNLEKLQCKREERKQGEKKGRERKKGSDRMERKLKVIKVIEQWERR